jgi:FSR family fosmidomycin resistance protein-like MFS transporter
MEKPLWLIYVTHMLVEVNLLIQVALIPVIIKEFQLGLLEASLVATVPSFVQLLMYIPSGYLTDRVSVKHLLFASMLVEGLSGFLVSQTTSFWTLVLGVSLLKISSPLYHITGLSQVSKLAKPEEMNRSMGVHNALGNLGSAVGVVSLAVFLSTLGWRWTYLFWAFPILAWGFIILASSGLRAGRFEKTAIRAKTGLKRWSLILTSGLLVFLTAIAVREVGATASSTYITTYFVNSRNLSESTASLIFGLGPFVGVPASLIGGYLGERTGARKALMWTIAGCSISLILLALVSHLYLLILVYVLFSFFSNATWAPMNALVPDITPMADIGLGWSIYFFTDGITTSIAPTLAAGIMELLGISFVFPFSAIFLISSLIILQFLPKSKNQQTLKT